MLLRKKSKDVTLWKVFCEERMNLMMHDLIYIYIFTYIHLISLISQVAYNPIGNHPKKCIGKYT